MKMYLAIFFQVDIKYLNKAQIWNNQIPQQLNLLSNQVILKI